MVVVIGLVAGIVGSALWIVALPSDGTPEEAVDNAVLRFAQEHGRTCPACNRWLTAELREQLNTSPECDEGRAAIRALREGK